MSIEFENPLTAGTVLVREQIQSQNYVAGSDGWVIKANGDAEFNSIVIRGGTVVSGLALYYDGTPALGNLIMSISATAGTDDFGNDYVAGIGVYGDTNRITVESDAGAVAQLRADAPSYVADEPSPGLVLSRPSGDAEPASLTEYDDTFDHGLYLRTSSPITEGAEGEDYAAIRMIGRYSTDPNIQLSAAGPDSFIALNSTLFDATGVAITYAGSEFNTYTPTIGGDGTATYSNRTGWWQRIGGMIFFSAYAVASGAGSGASNVTITAPTDIDRTTRQRVGATLEAMTAGNSGSCSAVAFTTGSGATFDRIRNSTGGNITGADITATSIIAVEGWYREA